MDFNLTIPDELLPGIVAIANAESTAEQAVTPEDVVQRYAEAAATKACQDMKVGPYWVGPIPPQFNQDGTPYVAPTDPPADAPVGEPPVGE